MKVTLALLLGTAAAFASDFYTGQAARLVIGQTSFTVQNPSSNDVVIGAPGGVAYAGNMLFVVDSNRVGAQPSNHRVLIYQNLSSQVPAPGADLNTSLTCPACVGQATLVLGQPDFSTNTINLVASATNMREPTAVASDGVHLAVADTDHNRVLIWNHIPTYNDQPADVVVGQPDFVTVTATLSPTATTLLGPQGVWIYNGKLFIADTQANRVLIYNHIPTTNGAAADLVLGQPNFTTYAQIDIAQQTSGAAANNLLNPVSVTTDGQRLYVADLGYSRVLIWNTIPTTNDAPADVAVGQPDLVSSDSNNGSRIDTTVNPNVARPVLCANTNGVDSNSNPIYPLRCAYTLSLPRFALAGGGRLFISDGGNDRVLVYDHIPTASGAAPDAILGQQDSINDSPSSNADALRTPMSLAWDGTNLYVADPYNRRIMVYSAGDDAIPLGGVRNGASFSIHATGTIGVSGSINDGDVITVAFADQSSDLSASNSTDCVAPLCHQYQYTVQASDSLLSVLDSLVSAINTSNNGAGDPYVTLSSDHTISTIYVTARVEGPNGDNVAMGVYLSTGAQISVSTGSGTLNAGEDTSKIAPGSLVTIFPITSTGSLTLAGSVNAGDVVTVNIAGSASSPPASYSYTVQSTDTMLLVANNLTYAINGSNNGAGDPYVYATTNNALDGAWPPYTIFLTANAKGPSGNAVTYSVRASSGAKVTAAAAGATLTGSAPLAYGTAQADTTQQTLPRELAGTSVYLNGVQAPLLYVSPGQINAQMPWEVYQTSSVNALIRATKPDGTISVSAPIGVGIVPANPGLFAFPNTSPPVAVAYHAFSHSTLTMSVDGGVTAGDTMQLTIGQRMYSYVVQEGDTLNTIRDTLSALVNAFDPQVTAINSVQYTRIIFEAKVAGPAGDGIPISGNDIPAPVVGGGATVLTQLASTTTCCSNIAGAPVTPANPAVTGEMIWVYATGLGVDDKYTASTAPTSGFQTGVQYPSNVPLTTPSESVSSFIGQKTANVLEAIGQPGAFGVFQVLLQVFVSLPEDPNTQLNIAQDLFVSNFASIPVVNPTLSAGQ